jgi:hypothetical protein
MLQQLRAVQYGGQKLEGRLDRLSTATESGLGTSIIDLLMSKLTSSRSDGKKALQQELVKAIHETEHDSFGLESTAITVTDKQRCRLENLFVARC